MIYVSSYISGYLEGMVYPYIRLYKHIRTSFSSPCDPTWERTIVDRYTQLQVQNGSARLMLDATTHKKLVGNPGNRPNPVLPSPKKIMVRLWGIIPFYGLKIQVSEI